MSENVTYHEHSPDTMVPGCRNTGDELVDGVVFLNVEPMEGFDMFIGRPSIQEAVAELYDLTPKQVEHRLVQGNSRIKSLEAEVDALETKLAELEAFAAAVREVVTDAS